jgi:WD40 repeat protein
MFDQTGRYLAAGGGKGVAVWSLGRGPKGVDVTLHRAIRTPALFDLAIHPSGASLAYLTWPTTTAAAQVFRCDLEKSTPPHRLAVAARNQLRGLYFDRPGHLLRYVTAAGSLGAWDWDRNVPSPGPDLPAFQWAPAPGGRWAAIANSDRAVVLHDLDTRAPILTLPPEESDVWALAWSPDHRRLAIGASDGVVAIWELEQVRAALAEFAIHIPEMTNP